jgi:choline-glycine betaine transporter
MGKHQDRNNRIGEEEQSDRLIRTPFIYEDSSIWERVLYGVITAIIAIGPFLIPGLTAIEWVMGLFGSVIVIYLIICILGVWESLTQTANYNKKARR